jgi:protein-tyrosine phosphatase
MKASGFVGDGARAGMAPAAPATFRVLHVCVGNICRSVLAERLMRLAFDAHDRAEIPAPVLSSSAGTHAMPGRDMHPRIATLLRARGAPTHGFASRRLNREHVTDADLVLTATRVERDHVVSLHPPALRRTFTLTEFARLVPYAVSAHRCESLTLAGRNGIVAAVLALRGHAGHVDPGGDDIPDPLATLGFRDCEQRVRLAIAAVVEALCTTAAPGGSRC